MRISQISLIFRVATRPTPTRIFDEEVNFSGSNDRFGYHRTNNYRHIESQDGIQWPWQIQEIGDAEAEAFFGI